MTTVFHMAAGVVDKAGNQIMHTTSKVGEQLQITTNRVFPPEQRQETLKKAHLFANRNPKLAAFLITQVALTGLPLILFLAFATTTLLVSLTTCVLLGLLASLAFTSFIVGFALLFVVPTVIIASCSATFIFIWGFMGYIVLRRFNEGEAPAKPRTRVGDGLQRLTSGRLGQWVADGSRIDGREKSDGQHASSTSGNSTRNGRHQNSGNTSLEKDAANLNGDSDSHGYVEWDRKWDNGVQPQSVVVETSNPYEVLKTETPVA